MHRLPLLLVALALASACRERLEPAPVAVRVPATIPAVAETAPAPAAAPAGAEGRWWDPGAPQPVRAPEPARKPLTSGGKAVLVAPGTGDIYLVEPAEYLEKLGQGYQPATRADVEQHNAEARAAE